MTLSDDHGELPAHAAALVETLGTLARRFVFSRAQYDLHMSHAERCQVLSDHLAAILTLCDRRHYAAGFAVARTALEHHLLDRLLFLANRWIQIEEGIKPDGVAAESARLRALRDTSRPDLVRWWWDDRAQKMKVLIRGFYETGSIGRGRTVSPYYVHVDQYDPFTLDVKLSSHLALGFRGAGRSERWHEQSMRTMHRYFTYPRLRENLDVNGLLRPRLGIQVDVHHAFLNVFVHASQKAYERLENTGYRAGVGGYDHYSSELLLLLVIAIGAAELSVFERMTRRAPVVRLSGWEDVEREIREAREASGYFWFLHGGPQEYDRIQEADTRTRIHSGRSLRRSRPDPTTIPDSGVRYYADPLRRLIALHGSYYEILTHQVYTSPFHRDDARGRY